MIDCFAYDLASLGNNPSLIVQLKKRNWRIKDSYFPKKLPLNSIRVSEK
jgi:hypothetical protein